MLCVCVLKYFKQGTQISYIISVTENDKAVLNKIHGFLLLFQQLVTRMRFYKWLPCLLPGQHCWPYLISAPTRLMFTMLSPGSLRHGVGFVGLRRAVSCDDRKLNYRLRNGSYLWCLGASHCTQIGYSIA